MILNALAWAIIIVTAAAVIGLFVAATIVTPALWVLWGIVAGAGAFAWAVHRISS